MKFSDQEINMLVDAAHKNGDYDRAQELLLVLEQQHKQRVQDFHQDLHDNDVQDLY
jgi:hypothetical protein